MPAYRPIAERLAAKTHTEGDCIVWHGAVRTTGYGVIGLERSGTRAVHRVAYELAFGPIPDGLHIDHLCCNRLCVKPAHLEAVTQRENNVRAGRVRKANNAHCKRGHAFTTENTLLSSRGGRQCRECHNLRNRVARRGMTLETFATLLEGGPDNLRGV